MKRGPENDLGRKYPDTGSGKKVARGGGNMTRSVRGVGWLMNCCRSLAWKGSVNSIRGTNISSSLVIVVRHKMGVERPLQVDKPARLIIRLLFGFGSDSVSVFVKLNKNEEKKTLRQQCCLTSSADVRDAKVETECLKFEFWTWKSTRRVSLPRPGSQVTGDKDERSYDSRGQILNI